VARSPGDRMREDQSCGRLAVSLSDGFGDDGANHRGDHLYRAEFIVTQTDRVGVDATFGCRLIGLPVVRGEIVGVISGQ
jgi:hypothetical protein